MMTRNLLVVTLILAATLGSSRTAHAVARSFTGNVSSDWATAGNWQPEGVPGPSDDVTIAAGKNAELATTATILTLDLAGTLGGGGDLTISNAFLWSDGAMIGSGATRVAGTASIEGGSAKSLGRALDLDNDAIWSGGDLFLSGDAPLTVGVGAVLQVTGHQVVRAGGGAPRIDNRGAIVKSMGNGTTGFIGVDLNNNGRVMVESGTLRFDGNGAHSGSFQAAGGTIEFAGGTHTLAASSRISGTAVTFNGAAIDEAGAYEVEGTTLLNAGTVTLRGHVGMLGALRIDGGILETRASNVVFFVDTLTQSDGLLLGDSIIVATGRTTWSGGEMSGFGITNANGDLVFDGGGTRTLTRLFTSNAATTWASSGFLIIGEGGLLQNRPDARFEVQSPFGVFTGGGVPRIENTGKFIHRSTNESRLNGVAFINQGDGVVEVTAGNLRFDGGYRQNSGVTRLSGGSVASNRAIMLNGGHLEGSGVIDAALSNAATISLSPAAGLRINGSFTQAATGNLRVPIGGTIAGSFGHLSVDTASLDGTLSVERLEGYEPKLGDSMTVMDFGLASGDFSAVVTTALASGLAFRAVKRVTDVVVEVVNCAPGLCQPTPTPDVISSPSPSPTPTPTATPTACNADCAGDGVVSIGDILHLIDIALAQRPLQGCMTGDLNGDGALTIEEIVSAVGRAAAGC